MIKVPQYAFYIIKTLKDAGFTAYLVGGCVRDHVMGRVPHDYDVATSAKPEQVMKLFASVIPTGIDHGTVTVRIKDSVQIEGGEPMLGAFGVEVTTYRGEGVYTDGRRPDDVVFLDSIEGDLARRDFSMNAMAYDPISDVLIDPFNGREDIRTQLVRCVGNPMERFGEDGLRPLRAIRFATVLGFDFAQETYAAIKTPEIQATYAKVAIERVMEEFRKIMVAAEVSSGLGCLVDTGLMARIFPAVMLWEPAVRDQLFEEISETVQDYTIRFARLVCGHQTQVGSPPLLEQLKLPTQFINRVNHLSRFGVPVKDEDFSDAALRKYAASIGRENVLDALALQRGVVQSSSQEYLKRAASFEKAALRLDQILTNKPPLTIGELALNGNEIGEIVGKGPAIGKALKTLLNAVLEDPAVNTKEGLKSRLKSGVEIQ